MSPKEAPWWRDAVGYEVYLRSFADSDGDGLGDLGGVLARLDHLAWLGVDFGWITPFYPSPMADQGYDVADHTGVDPRYGTLADVDAVVARAHGLGLRIVVDLVPNHTSDQHPWFVEARSSPDSARRSWYHWADPAPGGGPPNNWVSHFGGPAWTLDEASGQYYLHLFLPEQPDLRWEEPAVRDAFDDVLRFWLDRGVDGFRIDVAHALVKGAYDRPITQLRPVAPGEDPRLAFYAYEHGADLDQPGVLDVYRRWRRIADPHDALLLGEVYLDDPERVARYVRDGDGMHQSFFFGLLRLGWEPHALVELIRRALRAVPAGFAWVLSSHDDDRAVSRLSPDDPVVGRARTLALHTLLVALPGTPVLYMGEELGLTNGVVPADAAHDPVATRNDIAGAARDVMRTPIPWDDGPHLGFSTAERTWLPMGGRTAADTVAVQRADPGSPAAAYRRLLAARRRLRPDATTTEVAWGESDPARSIVARRGRLAVALDTSGRGGAVHLPAGRWRVAFSTRGQRPPATVDGALSLGPYEAVLLDAADDGGTAGD